MNIAVVEIGEKNTQRVSEIVACLRKNFSVDWYWYEENISPEDKAVEVADLQQNYQVVMELS